MLISAVELAGLQLPKLPNSRQGIEYHAKKNNWPFEEVAGRARGGKLKKYLVSALPSEVQAAIREKQAATLLAKVPVLPTEVKKPLRQNKKMRQLGLIPCEEGLARLDDRQTETAHARCAIVAHVLPLHELAGMWSTNPPNPSKTSCISAWSRPWAVTGQTARSAAACTNCAAKSI